MQQIKNLKKAVGINKRSDHLRFEGLHQTTDQLRKNSKCIKDELYRLSNRMDRIERTMGFYSGANRYKS